MSAIVFDSFCKQFSKGRQRITAVDNLNLSIAEGEAFGFVGANGAGKSTAIKALVDVIRPSSGSISLYGVDSREPSARQGMAYVPESPYMPDYLTPIDILTAGLKLSRAGVVDSQAHCMQWLQRLSVSHVANKKIKGFSKGMTQRVALAHAFALQPRLLILDEPLSGLDPVGRRDVVNLLIEYRKNGGTLFFTSHVLHDVESIADRYGMIHQGRLVAVKSAAEILFDNNAGYLIIVEAAEPLLGYQQHVGDRWELEASTEELWVQLEKIHAAGHTLISVKPKMGLESEFFTRLGLRG